MGIDDNRDDSSKSIVPMASDQDIELPFDLQKSVFGNSVLKGKTGLELRVDVPRTVDIYITPGTFEKAKLKVEPKLKTNTEKIQLIEKAVDLSKQAILEFIADSPQFTLEGGIVGDMDALLQSGTKPEEMIKDQAVVEFFNQFLSVSRDKFNNVDKHEFKSMPKEKVINEYQKTLDDINGTWDLSWGNQMGTPIRDRIDIHWRQKAPTTNSLTPGKV